MNHVIIGNGIAGVSAAESIRQLDGSGSIVMISDEPVDPYCRPMISLVLEGAISPSKLPIRDPGFYEALNITPVLGNRVARMDVDAKILFLSDGKTLPFALRRTLLFALRKILPSALRRTPPFASRRTLPSTHSNLLDAVYFYIFCFR